MSRIFITGSTDGLGLAAARTLMAEGHEVVLHARSPERTAALGSLAPSSLGVVTGDLNSADETRSVADQVNEIGRMDAVIHNAGVYLERGRGATPEGHARTIAVNTLAPYMLTVLVQRPDRLVYLSSGLHRSADTSLHDIDWVNRRWDAGQAYAESKLHVATLAAAVARLWPEVVSSAVDPGWVPTRMGGSNATDDLEMGHLTQTWLAVSSEHAARTSGKYWYHRQQTMPLGEVKQADFQDVMLRKLADLTGVEFP
ncbi:SDR family NAD(P)-dependent oxidoreductase [Sphingomonas faeni]|uniref:SDR family NAD(P)-dependent oxidoreductase n=1 Tax=Sphingomonas faeni TaxID=185950 RepID=UPI002788B869|nr:SDR family NAD(P)-dependent oxidoreductase [Sphingomonas faeni]MDQ0840128.1 NAD(P)-dependent dehydrogenase (short-subunit alcohol dehydrogenase family) [Sphingomonas faeni]